MAKRFTDNEKWKKQFFKSLSTVNKLLFLYILDDCDHAGVWHIEKDIAELRIGEKIDLDNAKKELGKHIVEFDNGEKWFIPFFIEFQYGTLNENVNAHKSVIEIIKKRRLTKFYEQFINSSRTVMDKDKDMDKEKDKEKDSKMTESHFEKFWEAYPNKKDKKTAKIKFLKLDVELFETIMYALEWQTQSSDWLKDGGQYIPMPTTYINNERWNDDKPIVKFSGSYTVDEEVALMNSAI